MANARFRWYTRHIVFSSMDHGRTVLTEQDLLKISKLSKIGIAEEEREFFLERLNKVFDWIDQLQQIDVSGIDLMEDKMKETTPERKDIPTNENFKDDVLSNAKSSKYGMFSVPKVIE